MNNIGALIGVSAADTESLYVMILFFVTGALALAVLGITKAARPEEPEDELQQPISELSMRKLCQRLEQERSIDPNRQS